MIWDRHHEYVSFSIMLYVIGYLGMGGPNKLVDRCSMQTQWEFRRYTRKSASIMIRTVSAEKFILILIHKNIFATIVIIMMVSLVDM